MSRLIPRSFALSAALVFMAGTGFAGTDAVQLGSLGSASAVERSESNDADVGGAAIDLADAHQWLAELEDGNFANIYVIANDGSMRCGEVEANSACKPLNAADKASAIAEAREAVGFATAAVEDAETSFAANEADLAIRKAAYVE